MITEIIQSIIIIYFEVICYRIFLDTFLPKRNYLHKYFERLMVVIIVLCFTLIGYFVQNFELKSCLMVIVMMVIAKLFYYATHFQNFVFSAIYYGILLGIDYLSILILKFLLPQRYMDILYGSSVSSTMVILLCKIFLFLTVLAIRWKWSKENDINLISNKEWVYFSYFPLFTIGSIAVMVLGFELAEENHKILLVIAFGLVIMNFMVFYLMHDLLQRERENRNSKLIQERTKNQMNFYRNMNDNYEHYKKKIHDYKNQLNCIQGMLVNGKLEEMQEYIANLTGSFIKDLDTIFTNHAVVDTVINQKYRYAKSKGVLMLLKVNDLSELMMREEDLVTLLSNILDNAIEACEKVELNKVIKFKMIVENELLLIATQNPLKEPISILDNKVVTTKSNKEEHGIGLLNVSSIVDKYNGIYAIKNENGWFHISIVLPYKTV